MNRKNFLRSAIIFIFVLVALFVLEGVFQSRERQNELSETGDWRTYQNESLGYRLQYPASWVLEFNNDASNSITFSNPANVNEEFTVAIVDASTEEVIRSSIDAEQELAIEVSGLPAVKLISSSQGDNRMRNVVMINQGKKLYYIAGDFKDFDKLIRSFEIINN